MKKYLFIILLLTSCASSYVPPGYAVTWRRFMRCSPSKEQQAEFKRICLEIKPAQAAWVNDPGSESKFNRYEELDYQLSCVVIDARGN